MSATTTRRTRPAKANLEAIADGTVANQENETPAPTKVVRRRTAKSAATPAPAPAPAKTETTTRRRRVAPVAGPTQADVLTPQAAPTTLGANGEMIRHTHDYTVDLLDPGTDPDRDYGKVLAKDPSEVHQDFVAWVAEHVGYDADIKTVQILISTYHEFQRTPAQKAKTIAKRQAAAEKRAEAEKAKVTKAAKAAAAAKVEAAKK